MVRTRWPKEVPVLTAKDMAIGNEESCRGKDEPTCLALWTTRVFGVGDAYEKAEAAICSAAGINRTNQEIFDYNDSHSRRHNARVWNRAMARLGYVVGNPEAKHVKREARP